MSMSDRSIEPRRFYVTHGVFSELKPLEILDLLGRHLRADWGEMTEEDKAQNEEALRSGGRLKSSFTVRSIKVWAITEDDRSVTTLLLPDEY